MYRTILLCLICICLNLITKAQSICEKLAKSKTEYYGFKPNSLNKKQKETKSAQLDTFWGIAKQDPDGALPCLKEMIASENNDPYFCFDAATLILTIDKDKKYLDAVLEGARKCDLSQLQAEPYLRVSFFLANNGKNIDELSEKLISTPKVNVFLTLHAINLNAIDASLFLYNTMPTDKAEQNLIRAITSGTPTGKHNAAVVLNLLSTNRGDSLLNNLISNNKLADSTKTFILNDRKAFIKQSIKPTMKTEDQIRAERTASIKGLSDESLQRYFTLTGELMSLRNKD